ncbi:MFS general substrate transporter [Glarea lozoyensis ATCC 20868]|uniref:MFS general substrate transporter n=1 Tax=Glarea lozoyensis (strain ATCC 20868 / MF5171) TaxID=1116229 RepID=S3D4H2_GLAL2|nr:MFS general substrate transporter [Glarea lozoyensis ATCC 20868]EPE26976.1 MFS general substrate transporter [Glarea lozoyensis ATCC 20868]
MEDNHVKRVEETITATNHRDDENTEKIEKSMSSSEMMKLSQPPIISIAEENQIRHLTGWRLYLLTTGLCLSVFLSSLDITIVSTSLAAIANDFHVSDQASWIVSSYLLTYSSFIIVWAKLSDIFGRKTFLTIALVLFLLFSGVCGGAKTLIQLIIFRAFQGVGGAGIFAMTPAIIAEMVPSNKFAKYNALASSAIGISFLMGPLVGGVISDRLSWRWIFFINLPVGTVAAVLALVSMPTNFPNHQQPLQREHSLFRDASIRIDFPGFLLFLISSLLLVCALQEAGTEYAWSSALVISFLTISAVCWMLLFAWQRFIAKRQSAREPVLPWKFLKHRVLMGAFLTALFAGVPFTAIIIEYPQRFQVVNCASSLNAGVRLLPFSLPCALGSALTGGLTSSLRIPPIFVVLAGTILQTVGLALEFSVNTSLRVPAPQYGYEALVGFGVGLTLTTLLSIAGFAVEGPDRAVALSGVTQLRVLGGTVGVSMVTNLLNSHVKASLASILPPYAVRLILETTQAIEFLDPPTQDKVRLVFADGYKIGTGAVLGFTTLQFLSILLMWEKTPRKIPR